MPLSFLFCFSFLVCRVCFVSAVPRRKDFVSPGVNARRAVLDDVTAVDAWRRQRTRLTRTDRMVCACVRDESPANERSILRYIYIYFLAYRKEEKWGSFFKKIFFFFPLSIHGRRQQAFQRRACVCVCLTGRYRCWANGHDRWWCWIFPLSFSCLGDLYRHFLFIGQCVLGASSTLCTCRNRKRNKRAGLVVYTL